MITKYKSYWQTIKEVQVEKETENSVWINGRRASKRTEFESYHDSFEDAKTHLLRVAEYEVQAAKSRLARSEANREAIKALTP